MLVLENIKKDYKTAGGVVHALKGVSLRFRKNEFVSVLGASGCGKTTLLNIIGGLDHYTSGDLIISGKSTKAYKDRDWDVYRNHRIGFVFQSYNLIPHQTVLGNVELALTIAGMSKTQRRAKAKEALIKVGLENELKKRPNQLSGGQMQRVAIARALVNDPEILLADEPTGALDTETSVQIMDLIREIAHERLVIMVTHNPDIAEEYSTRIVHLKDGLVVSDTNPYEGDAEEEQTQETIETTETVFTETVPTETEQVEETEVKVPKKKERSSMSFKTSLGLSARNLLTKKGRTAVTSIAGSIGIISVCLVLALSNGFNMYIKKTEEDMLSKYPVEIAETTLDVNALSESLQNGTPKLDLSQLDNEIYIDSLLTQMAQGMQVKNNISNEYLDYIQAMPDSYYTAIQYNYGETLMENIFTEVTLTDNGGTPYTTNMSLSSIKYTYTQQLKMSATTSEYAELAGLVGYLGAVVNKMPGTVDFTDERFSEYVLSQYDVIGGETARFPQNENEAVLVVGANNDILDLTLAQLGFIGQDEFLKLFDDSENVDNTMDYTEILNKQFTLYYNDAVYTQNSPSEKYAFTYNGTRRNLDVENDNGVNIKITAILRLKEGRNSGCLSNGLNITEKLVDKYIAKNKQSKIVNWMLNPSNSIGPPFFPSNLYLCPSSNLAYLYDMTLPNNGGNYALDITKALRQLGGLDTVSSIGIYTSDFEAKESLIDYLEAWNTSHTQDEEVAYNDRLGMVMSMVETMLNAITYVLVAFTAISLVVSSVMIGIITYVSVVERTKEIGVLRSLGARKKDIKNLFNAETFIIGLASGGFGVAVTYLLSLAINAILNVFTGIATLASLPITSAIVMVCVSIVLTLVSGLIPARSAAKKDPVIALRTE